MRQIASAIAIATLLATPVAAQDEFDPDAQEDGDVREGFSLMEEGSRLILRGLIEELEPTLDEMEGLSDEMREGIRAFAGEMGPALLQMTRMIDEIRYYEAPEILDNGDIIIRRKPDAPAYEPPEPGDDGMDSEELGDEAIDL